MRQTLHPILTFAFASSLSLSAQNFTEGYDDDLRQLPGASVAATVLSGNQGHVYFTGTKLVYEGHNQRKDLLSFPSKVFGSFTLQIGTDDLLFGENSTHGVWKVAILAKRAPIKLATITYNYDAVKWGKNHALISAKTGGFSAKDNQIVALNLTTGKTQTIADLPGASGPVTTNKQGDLFYATASLLHPPPRGFVSLLHFPNGKLQAALVGRKLAITDASIRFRGLDAASSLVLDDDGDAFVTDWYNRKIIEIHGLFGPSPTSSSFGDYNTAAVGVGNLQWLKGSGSQPIGAQFEPFQPVGAGWLIVHESKYLGISQLRILGAEQPDLRSNSGGTIGQGAFTLTVTGPKKGSGILAFRPGKAGNPIRQGLPGYKQDLFWEQTLLAPLGTIPITFDKAGKFSLKGFNPGLGQALPITFQAAFLTDKRRVIGSTLASVFTFR